MNSSDRSAVLIVAPSGRALAAAARRAGYLPLVADFFDDLDTRALAAKTCIIAASERGFEAPELIERLRELAAGRDPIGIVYGGGFEDRPQLIEELARHFKVYGNSPDVVAKIKDPVRLAELCQRLAIPHPKIRFAPPQDMGPWLVKRIGGGGGLHIAPASERVAGSGEYYQLRLEGRPVSALLLCDGRRAEILGLSDQWAATDPERPFRFAGAVRPSTADPDLAGKIGTAAAAIAAAAGLVGLNSVDFLADGKEFHLLEINPRPGATLDIFADRDGRLFAAHIAACEGRLPDRPLAFPNPAATAIFYAPFALRPMPPLAWPDWCRDRQKPGTCLHKGDPICTVAAEADTPKAARALLDERLASFLTLLTKSASEEAVA